jgi:hypothetical protein
MAEYSSKSDVKDPALQGITQEADHAEAERALTKELKRRNIDPAAVPDPEVLKDLSVAYACWKRCLYSVQSEGDMFDIKRKAYKTEYVDGLERLNAEMVAGTKDPQGGKRVFGTVATARG